MKKRMLAAVVALSMATVAVAKMKDWHDLHKAHLHLQQVVHELERARAANHYDMAGHGEKAEALARQAERELSLAVDAAKAEK